MKLWGGRFSKETDKNVNDFNSSIRFDRRLYRHDITGSIAHAKMLSYVNIITEEESLDIERELLDILSKMDSGEIVLDESAEDIHTEVERLLIQRLGDTGKKLHTGRSRNDQVALDLRMYIKEEIYNIKDMLIFLEETILKLAEEHIDVIMPGYTHLQRAQPISFGHWIMAYFQMFARDIQRLDDCHARTDFMPLGAGALAGTTYPLDRDFVRSRLGFSHITKNSLDSVSDRDFAIEFLSALSLIMMHLSRFSEEIVIFSSHEFGFIEMDDAYSTGSSIMPQKKNPDVAELVRGKTGRVYGSLITLLTVMKSLPLAYNKDMQEDKEAVFDSLDTVKLCLGVFPHMISTMKLNRGAMLDAARGGYTNATDVADYLVKKGMPFRDAHEVTGRIVMCAIAKKLPIDLLPFDELKSFSPLISKDIFDAISPENCVSQRKLPGGPAVERVRESIEDGLKFLTEARNS